ncbi:MAG: AraC family transcriptional regulator [Clostridiales bacterium]|nr:AraC family transcriptional regulator [Clostridiales bacterium]
MSHTEKNLQQELKEKARHGDIFLPLQKYTAELMPLYPSVSLHWHEELEFTRIMEGTAHYQIGLTDFDVREGDLILVQPHVLHSVTRIDRAYMRSETFVFHMNFLSGNTTDACSLKYLKPIADGTLFLPCLISVSHPDYMLFERLFSQIYHCYEQKSYGYELALKTYFFELFRLLFEKKLITASEDTAASSSQSDKLKEILQYIRQHFSEDLSVSKAADFCHINPYYFMHFFKENTGMTFVQYLNDYRLRQAALLLKKENCSITEAALSCGFNNLSYFHKRFREYYGMTPKEFQKTVTVKDSGIPVQTLP